MPRFHRRRHANRPMNPAEIVMGEVKAVSGPEAIPPLAEAIRDSREARHLHSDREVLALHCP
jgi:hypothetical protein